MRPSRLLIGAACAAAAFVCGSGCGYTSRSNIADKYHTVYIPAFKNKVDISKETTASNLRLYRPHLETDITAAVTQRFLLDGNLKPVDSAENADLVLTGSLIDFRKDALSYNRNDDVTEYRVSVVVSLALTRPGSEAPVWVEPSFTGYTTYFLTGNRSSSESVAIADAIKDLARRIVERTIDQW